MRALVLGSTGQDGSYLVEHLKAEGHEVHTTDRYGRDAIYANLTDAVGLREALDSVQPDVIFNLAAVTAPGGAWGTRQPDDLVETTALGVLNLLEAMRRVMGGHTKLVHASSSAIYNPHRYGLYGISKQFAHDVVLGYQVGEGMHVSNAILYSHTSPRQDQRFLAPTIVRTLARIAKGSGDKLLLQDPFSRRDWGYAPDFVKVFPLIAAQWFPGDYVVATGKTHSAEDFINIALHVAGLTWDQCVEVVPGPQAPPEKPADLKASLALGWQPETSFEDMVTLMMKEAME